MIPYDTVKIKSFSFDFHQNRTSQRQYKMYNAKQQYVKVNIFIGGEAHYTINWSVMRNPRRRIYNRTYNSPDDDNNKRIFIFNLAEMAILYKFAFCNSRYRICPHRKWLPLSTL